MDEMRTPAQGGENQNKAKSLLEAGKKAANKMLGKADELYNKLPLDSLNKRFGGKVDLKSKTFKIGAAAVLFAILFLMLLAIFGGDGEVRFDLDKFMTDSNAEMDRMTASLPPKDRVDFRTAFIALSAKFTEEVTEQMKEDVDFAKEMMGLSDDEKLEIMMDWFDRKTPRQIIDYAKRELSQKEWDDLQAMMLLQEAIK